MAERRVSAPKNPSLAETGPDRDIFNVLLAIAERALDAAEKKLGAPAKPGAYRSRVLEAIELALNDRQLTGTRRQTFYRYLTAELGARGGAQAAEKQRQNAEFEEAIMEDRREREIESAQRRIAELHEHVQRFGPGEEKD